MPLFRDIDLFSFPFFSFLYIQNPYHLEGMSGYVRESSDEYVAAFQFVQE